MGMEISRRVLLCSVVAAVLAACGGGSGSTPTTPGGTTGVGAIALTLVPASGSLQQGNSGFVTVNVARTNFSGSIAFAVTGLPAGVTASFNAASTVGSTATLTLTAAATAPLGTTTITIRATGAGIADGVAVLTLQVTAASGGSGSGSTVLNFSACVGSARPIWLAYQDGDGVWVPVTPVNNTYAFTITQSRDGYVYVTSPQAGLTRAITLFYGTKNEISSNGATQNFCVPTSAGTKTITGTIANFAGPQLAFVSLGGITSTSATAGSFTLNAVRDGAHDLAAFRGSLTSGSANDRGIIRQDQNLATGTNVGTLDLTGAESFALSTGTFTLGGIVAGEVSTAAMQLLSGASCDVALVGTWQPGASPFTASGVPDARLRAADMHMITTTGNSGTPTTTTSRLVTEVFHSMGNRTVSPPANIAPVTVVATGNYKRLNTAFTLPAEFNTSVALSFAQSGGSVHTVTITATVGWVNGTTVGLVLPNFTGLAGWEDSYGPALASQVTFSVAATGTNLAAGQSQCTAGLRNVNTTVSGTM